MRRWRESHPGLRLQRREVCGRLGGRQTQGNALGTSYFSGGLTRVNEQGGEIIDLPSGTRIIPHDVSLRMAEQTAGSSVVHLVGRARRDGAARLCCWEIRELLRQLVRRRSRGDVRVTVIVQGNVIGNRAFADELGRTVGRRAAGAGQHLSARPPAHFEGVGAPPPPPTGGFAALGQDGGETRTQGKKTRRPRKTGAGRGKSCGWEGTILPFHCGAGDDPLFSIFWTSTPQ